MPPRSVAARIDEGKGLFQQASGLLLRSRPAGRAVRDMVQHDRLTTELTSVTTAFDAAVRRAESASRVAHVHSAGKGGAAAAGGSRDAADSDDDEEAEARRAEQTRAQLREQIVGVRGFGEVEMNILKVCLW